MYLVIAFCLNHSFCSHLLLECVFCLALFSSFIDRILYKLLPRLDQDFTLYPAFGMSVHRQFDVPRLSMWQTLSVSNCPSLKTLIDDSSTELETNSSILPLPDLYLTWTKFKIAFSTVFVIHSSSIVDVPFIVSLAIIAIKLLCVTNVFNGTPVLSGCPRYSSKSSMSLLSLVWSYTAAVGAYLASASSVLRYLGLKRGLWVDYSCVVSMSLILRSNSFVAIILSGLVRCRVVGRKYFKFLVDGAASLCLGI